jgi:hypothetical protein
MAAATRGTSAGKFDRPAALLPLLSICLSELRRDLALLFDSDWAESPRRRARELVAAIEQAGQRQGLQALTNAARSMKNLLDLSRKDAVPLGSALPEKLEELLKLAEKAVLEESKRRTA